MPNHKTKLRDLKNIIPFTSDGLINSSVLPAGSGLGGVDSVAGKLGDVELNANDVSETAGLKWLTDAEKNKLAGIETGAQVNVPIEYGDVLNTPYIPENYSDLTDDRDTVEDSDYVHTDNNFTDAEKTKLSGIEVGAEVNEQIDWNGVGTAGIINKPENATVTTDGFMSSADKVKLDLVNTDYQVRSNYTESDPTSPSFILNKPAPITQVSQLGNDAGYLSEVTWATVTDKPNFHSVATSGSYNDLSDKPVSVTKTSELLNDSGFVQDVNYNHTQNDFTDTMLAKLQGIETNAEVNIRADWDATVGDAVIDNKPLIPTLISELPNDANYITDALGYTHTDNNFTDAEKLKLESLVAGGEPNIQIDWEGTGLSGITNKPVFHAVATSGDYNDLINTPVGGGGTDSKTVLVSAGDTTDGYLGAKIVGGTNVTVTNAGAGGDEKVVISAVAAGGAANFTELLDTPSSLIGDRFIISNSAGDGLVEASIHVGNLSDVNTVDKADGDVLIYNSTTEDYETSPITVGDISDIDTPVLSDGMILKFNVLTGNWEGGETLSPDAGTF